MKQIETSERVGNFHIIVSALWAVVHATAKAKEDGIVYRPIKGGRRCQASCISLKCQFRQVRMCYFLFSCITFDFD